MRGVEERKGIEAPNMKHPIQFRAFDALIGDEEQNRKQKKKKERNREQVPN